ncbi:hypothetical protein [Flavobacterium sandaracinum]|uniref:hypothetical protein n=1 Tax=Flavobacterium sandaracinum TaxID=2541733 RepID=UPI001404E629|nr:hypothetical protein [Flavobacterium sandaracinum]
MLADLYSAFVAFLLINEAVKFPANEYNTNSGSLNKYENLKGLKPTVAVPSDE